MIHLSRRFGGLKVMVSLALLYFLLTTQVHLAVGLQFVQALPLTGSQASRGSFYNTGYGMAFRKFEKEGGLWWNGRRVAIADATTVLDSGANGGTGGEALDTHVSLTATAEHTVQAHLHARLIFGIEEENREGEELTLQGFFF